MCDRSDAMSEAISTILIISLVVVLGIIIGGLLTGLFTLQPKSAYIVPRLEVTNVSGKEVISLFSQGGDPAILGEGGSGQYALAFYLDTPGGTIEAEPDPGVVTWHPGETLYLYNSPAGLRMTSNLTTATLSPMPAGSVTVRIVDEHAKILVTREGIVLQGTGTVAPTPTPACIPGTGWRIWNKDTVAHSYRLQVEPGGPVISQGTIPKQTQRFVWFNLVTAYKANLTTLENHVSEVRGSGSLVCQFSQYENSFTGANPIQRSS